MTATRTRNVSASVLARLLALAKRTGDDYQTLLNAYAAERFLYRLSASAVSDRFVLKGAMLLRLWADQPYRSTRDLDLLRQGGTSAEGIRADIERICTTAVDADGIEFQASTIQLELIRPEDEYAGTRVTLIATCGTARLPFQVDIGIGDSVWPAPNVAAYPVLLEFPAPIVRTYTRDSVIAEKLEAMIVLGDRNSRIKDFFDLRYLADHFEFERETLTEAIRRTFERRKTPIPEDAPAGLTTAYWENPSRPAQVKAFARRAGLDATAADGKDTVSVLRLFLLPILEDLRRGVSVTGSWPVGGPWQ